MSWKIHRCPSALIGGFRALLMQALHPVAMAAVDQHGDFRKNTFRRLFRTINYVLLVTYGDRATVDAAAARVRARHRHIQGIDPVTGQAYRADDPDLLRWVHAVEVDSFLVAHETYTEALPSADADRYVAERAWSANLVGLHEDVPTDVAGLKSYLQAMTPVLALTPAAEDVQALTLHPPLPAALRPVRKLPGAGAVATMPRDHRQLYRVVWSDRRDRTARQLGRLFCRAAGLLPDPPIIRSAEREALLRGSPWAPTAPVQESGGSRRRPKA
jgi:uncharacterized protein (DUF2236 family)